MSEILRQHLKKFVALDDGDFSSVLKYFRILHFKKKENLLTEGEVCRSNFFVARGCLRMFFIDEQGIEKTTQFALEHWWLADYFSFQKQQKSHFNIQAVENSEVWALNFHAQEQLLSDFPQMERYFRLVHQTAHAASQVRLRYVYDLSKEELYRYFSNNFPEFIQRVPQYLLASYLNMTPEYLSELRAKITS
ncbi:Crp/Fnr family transcriptional regulator [Daejeonella lutea]|uniref:cAMP-binding domain of CRP or a regulatory subunit of cAMP-dependent protein kinases n=1 Tax=Daejeonella lutea TaxID=572036 RepID=A0A1T5DFZ4_9SPHI|nr:Crp/Fnr family transcriptional regulator [Daejeonella lutea]SKB70624.1 cAMP-binding domain of CRP or a regulatory subunit of cAMP-dependent protein kinases [Daejeonella lutea]